MGFESAFKASFIIDMVDKVSNPLDKISDKIKNLDEARNVVGNMGLAMAGTSAAVIAVGTGFVSAASQVDNYKTQLEVMLGSQEKANQRYRELAELSNSTTYSTQEIVSFGNQLQAIGRYSSDLMIDLGNLASGAGKPLEQVATAYSKLASGEKGMAVDMFRSLLISTEDWQKALGKDVKNASAEEMMAVLPKIINDMKNFGGMMDKQSKTFSGAFGLMTGLFWDFQAKFGESLLAPVKNIMNGVSSLLSKMLDFADAHPKIANGIGIVVGTLAVLGVVLGVSLFLYSKMNMIKTSLITNSKLLSQAITRVTGSMIGGIVPTNLFSAALKGFAGAARGALMGLLAPIKLVIGGLWAMLPPILANPITWIILGAVAAIALLVAGIRAIIKNWDLVGNSIRAVGKMFIDLGKSIIKSFKVIFAIIFPLPTLLIVLLGKLFNFIGSKIGEVLKKMGGIGNIIFEIRKKLAYLSGAIAGGVVFLLSKVTQTIKAALDSIFGTIEIFGKAAGKILASLFTFDPQKIKAAVDESGKMIGDHFNNLKEQWVDVFSANKMSDEGVEELKRINEQTEKLNKAREVAKNIEEATKNEEKIKRQQDKVKNKEIEQQQKQVEIVRKSAIVENMAVQKGVQPAIATREEVIESVKPPKVTNQSETKSSDKYRTDKKSGEHGIVIQNLNIKIDNIDSIKSMEDFIKILEVEIKKAVNE